MAYNATYKNTESMYKKMFSLVLFILCLLMFAFYLSKSLAIGGRWSSGLPLGGVDNFLYHNGGLYTVPEKGFTPGSSYFPGIVLLSLIFRLLFGYGAETAIIFFGAIVALFSFLGFSIIATNKKNDWFYLTLVAVLFFLFQFASARSYLLEMHPDIPALVCFIYGIIFIDKFIKKNNHLLLIPATILFLCSALFKQNAIALYFGLGVYVLFTKTIKVKQKIYIIFSELIAGILTLIVVFSIEGCYYNCVTVNRLHPLLSIKEYIVFCFVTFRETILFCVGLAAYLILLITKNIKLDREIERLWFAASVCWVVLCMYGAAKDGANQGNMEAAIITFMPFVLILCKNFILYIKTLFNFEKISDDCNSLNAKKMLKICIFSCLLIFFLGGSSFIILKTIKAYSVYKQRIAKEKEFSSWLTENYKNKNIAYTTIAYELLNGSDIHKTSDFYTICVWELAKLISDNKLKDIAEQESWDLIITWQGLDDTTYPLTFENFRRLDESEYPDVSESYYKPIKVFVRGSK